MKLLDGCFDGQCMVWGMWWEGSEPEVSPISDILICCKMVTMIVMANTWMSSYNCHFFFVVRMFKIYSLSNFQVHNTVLLTIISILYIRSPGLTCLTAGGFYPLIYISLSPDSHLLVKWSESASHSVVSDSLWPRGLYYPGILQARTLEQVDIPFSRGSSQPRDWTWVSLIAGGFFISWATREATSILICVLVRSAFLESTYKWYDRYLSFSELFYLV